ncbi:N-carbamoylputrescine amidase [hydrothermal vent metagenome]|uniref:N-carbamoylputrescine amidase n=1 Tax=hydrothermal vent metagenome TaxID=652676 RepID=A0A3B1BQ63_9ZZZZ
MSNKTLSLALVQHSCNRNYQQNLDRSITGIREAAAKGAQLILLQELHTSHYFCQQEQTSYFDLAETIPGPTSRKLAALAGELDVVIVASVFEKRAPGLYHNTAVVLERDGSIAGIYRKMHVPDDPGYYEKFYFTPGDQPDKAGTNTAFTPIETSLGKLGVLVCWDQWFPEAARLMSLAGADILLYPTAIGWDEADNNTEQQRQRSAWRTIQQAHAIANGIPVAACNRCGIETADNGEEHIHFWGSSFVAGPQGELLAEAPTDNKAVILAELNLSHSETVRQNWPYLRDRRTDAYADLSLRYRDHIKTNQN